MDATRLTGRVLWRDLPGATPTWVEGAWIHNGRLTRHPDPRWRCESVDGYAVPGLVDVHCHLGYSADGITDAERTIADAQKVVRTGVLLVRDAGIPERANDILRGRDDTPALIRCGRHIARPKRYIRGLSVDLDDPDDLAEEMARQAGRSDGWVKIIGDWIDRSAGPDADLSPLWTPAQLAKGVAAAHAAGARVAVHTFSHAALDALLDAGVDDIEHGSGLSRDQALRCRDAGIPVTPTLAQIELFSDFAQAAGEKYPVYRDTMAQMWRDRVAHFQMLLDCGVQLLPGTDSGGYQAHGSLPQELARWQAWGGDPAEILAQATWRARDFLGAEVLSEGAPADVVVYASSPESDTAVLAAPRAVWRAGRRLV